MKKKKQEETANVVSLYEVYDKDAANRQFINKVVKPNDGGNNHVNTFLKVLERVFSTSQSNSTFSLFDVIRESKGFELDPVEVRHLFEKWIEVMLRLNKITEIVGCYSYSVYLRVG